MSDFIDQVRFNELSYNDKWRLARDTQIIRERLEQEITRLKARNEKLERVREAAQDVLMIYASFGQYDPNKLIDALKDCEEAARSGE